jgi:hypothetical protein
MAQEWYIAELVMEITVADDTRNILHQSLTLSNDNSGSKDQRREKSKLL